VSIAFDKKAPNHETIEALHPWRILHEQELTLPLYFHRHDIRFEYMKMVGLWNLMHPWYECFVPRDILKDNLPILLEKLPANIANLVQVAPIFPKKSGFMQFPKSEAVCTIMVLNPGLPELLRAKSLEMVAYLDAFFMPFGGKRYLSGYLGENIQEEYWKAHFGEHYDSWIKLKQVYDPAHIFCSNLFKKES
jgi:hypothetical protein